MSFFINPDRWVVHIETLITWAVLLNLLVLMLYQLLNFSDLVLKVFCVIQFSVAWSGVKNSFKSRFLYRQISINNGRCVYVWIIYTINVNTTEI